MASRFETLLHPARFQSAHKADRWFEGWYFKLVDDRCSRALAVIPGLSRDEQGDTSHAFVQLIEPGGHVRYIRYPFEAFAWAEDRFEIAIDGNRFSASGIELDLPAEGTHPRVRGAVAFEGWRPWPITLTAPGIMGWYRYVPRMECYHGVLSLDHALSGVITLGEDAIVFDGGRGYAEKDWGTSFPSSWVWVQSNRFVDDDGAGRPGVSLTLSVARIPWLGTSFTGHIAGLLLDDGRLMRFATYTGSRLAAVETYPGGAAIVVRDREHELLVVVTGTRTGELKAPVLGAMLGRADEALDGHVRVELRTRSDGRLLFAGTGTCAGAEVMNDRGELSADRSAARR